MENQEILEKIAGADMVLVGLGEEFDHKRALQRDPKYVTGCEVIKEVSLHWLIPAWDSFCAEKQGEKSVAAALEKLKTLLQEKNYFVVSVSTNSEISKVDWKYDRYVMPCGSEDKKQCSRGCEGLVTPLREEDRAALHAAFEALYSKGTLDFDLKSLGVCAECGEPLVLNNIYVENYNEKGYLQQWELYRKWLQGTVNRQLLVLELGVGMKFPSVIRWPFEKVAFFNQKAYFCRVNERLYQLTEELSGKGCGIPQNSIDWLAQL